MQQQHSADKRKDQLHHCRYGCSTAPASHKLRFFLFVWEGFFLPKKLLAQKEVTFCFDFSFLYHVTFSADNCKKLGLVFDDVVGIVEMINCKDVKVQVSVCVCI